MSRGNHVTGLDLDSGIYSGGAIKMPSGATTAVTGGIYFDTTAVMYRLGAGAVQLSAPGGVWLDTNVNMVEAKNFVLGTTTGTKIGTATTQKLSFYGATPKVQPNGWGSPTGTTTKTTFATGSVTLPQLAERVKGLIDDLISTGLIGV